LIKPSRLNGVIWTSSGRMAPPFGGASSPPPVLLKFL
jgi:hypothetical protein